ncbi:MAG: HAD family hydrolase [Patescibacteria group bacterium]|nr:HAD family hydrolase [Patescibacteria group bacterium]
MIKLVAFDWNGTIISDTRPTWLASNMVFEKYGLKPISLKKFKDTFSIPIIDFYTANGFAKSSFMRVYKQQALLYYDTYDRQVKYTRSRGGTREVIKWIHHEGLKAIIYSNHLKFDIEKNLKRLGLTHYFDEILGRTTVHGHNLKRTKETKLLDYLKSNKFYKSEILTIGDTCEEIEIAHSLKIKSVALTGGWNSSKRLKACKPDFLIHNLKDLIPIIKKLNASKNHQIK